MILRAHAHMRRFEYALVEAEDQVEEEAQEFVKESGQELSVRVRELIAELSARTAASGVKVTFTLYIACAPIPRGHHSLTPVAAIGTETATRPVPDAHVIAT